jgi:hypothetical protein
MVPVVVVVGRGMMRVVSVVSMRRVGKTRICEQKHHDCNPEDFAHCSTLLLLIQMHRSAQHSVKHGLPRVE